MESECIQSIVAVTTPLLVAIKVLWSRYQSALEDRATALREAAGRERASADRLEALLRGNSDA